MDAKDREILYALDRDSRISFAQLGRETRLSAETARNRVRSLVERGVIGHFVTILNPSLLGFSYYQLYFRLRKVELRQRARLREFLMGEPRVCWIGELEGAFDLGIIVIVKDHAELDGFCSSLSGAFGALILRKALSINMHGEFLPRDHLSWRPRTRATEPSYRTQHQGEAADGIDLGICRMLAADSRASATAIASRTGIGADAVAGRIRRLKERGIITGFSIVLGSSAVPQLHFKILLRIEAHGEQRMRSLLGFVKSSARVLAVVRTLAEWDVEIDLEVEDMAQLNAFTSAVAETHSGDIKDYEILRVLSMPKYNFFPSV